MSQINNDFDPNNPEVTMERFENGPFEGSQGHMIDTRAMEAMEWTITPAELYGCLCHRVEKRNAVDAFEH